MKQYLKRLGSLISAFFPTSLPQSDLALKNWCNEVIELCGLPPDNDSLVQALATQIMHLGPTVAYKSKLFFMLSIRKAIANQSAFTLLNELRDKKRHDTQTIQATSDQVVS